MVARVRWLTGLLLVAACWFGALAAETRVEVARANEGFVIDAILVAPVPLREAWAVLTDFDAMSGFVPDLLSSRVTRRSGTRLQVEQHGVIRLGPFLRDFRAVREIELTPFERVSSHLISGTLRKVDTETRFAPVADGTEVRHHVELSVESWMPDVLIEVYLRQEISQQLTAMVQEMQRRNPGGAAPR
jgi:hypothetical protein